MKVNKNKTKGWGKSKKTIKKIDERERNENKSGNGEEKAKKGKKKTEGKK